MDLGSGGEADRQRAEQLEKMASVLEDDKAIDKQFAHVIDTCTKFGT